MNNLHIEEAAKAIYKLFPGAEDHPWVEGGNSNKQEEARRYARTALETAESSEDTRGPTGKEAVNALLKAMTLAGVTGSRRAMLVGYFANEWNKLLPLPAGVFEANENATYDWLVRASKCGVESVEAAAKVMKDYYEGAESEDGEKGTGNDQTSRA